MSSLEESYARLRRYADDLHDRVVKQKHWHERNPGVDPLNEYEYTRALHESDPYPSTNDVLSVERFSDLLIIALHAYEVNYEK